MICTSCKEAIEANLEGAIVGEATCENCAKRADENRRGVHGRGPQEWQRKVDVVAVPHVFRCSRCPVVVMPWEPLCAEHRAEMLADNNPLSD